MRLPEALPSFHAPAGVLIAKEMRDLLAGRAFWVLLLLLSPLVGYGFDQAVQLYAEASRAAAQSPELARGLSPFDGIVVPTFGALYFTTTFLFPFVVIRAVAAEKQDGAHKLMQQLPYRTAVIVAAKVAVLGLAWLAMAAVCLSALLLWMLQGGHLSLSEVAAVMAGHALYAAVVAGIGLAAAAMTESMATAAILTLAATVGFWVLDFAASSDSGALGALSGLSLTAVLRQFERGIFSLGTAGATLAAACGLVCLAAVWWPAGRRVGARALASAGVLVLTAAAIAATSRASLYADAREDRRNSFSAGEAAALAQLRQRLTVTVNLRPEDPRYIDFNNGVLGKLIRTVPDIAVIKVAGGRSEFATQGDDNYGQIALAYAGRYARTRSTSANEILPLIYELTNLPRPQATPPTQFAGYPLVADSGVSRLWFYAILPAVVAAAWLARGGLLRRGARSAIRP